MSGKGFSSTAGAVSAGTGSGDLLQLVRHEATKFGRCCDLYQDGLGTFADHECQQRTFAMLRGVQQVLGVAKDGSPLTEAEAEAARARARLNNAAPDLLEALKAVDSEILLTGQIKDIVEEAIAKTEGR